MFSLLDRNEEALVDLNFVMDSPFLQGDDRLRAVVTRIVTYYRLNMISEAQKELEIFKSIYPLPKLEVYNDTVIIRNIPDCTCSQELLKLFVANTFCESLESVKITNGICIGKRKSCEKECGKNGCPLEDFNAANNQSHDCKFWCDKMQVAGNAFCAGTFKKFKCQAICIATVEIIKDGCYWCCDQGNFYQR